MSTNPSGPLLASALLLLALGCDDPKRSYDTSISFPETQVLLERGARRLSLEVQPAAGYVLVDELRVRSDDELLDNELLTVRVEESAFRELTTEGGCAGTIAGTPAGLIRFDEDFTTFQSNDADITCGDFVSLLTDLVEGGNAPLLTASRTPSPLPQDPDDPVFFAQDLTIAEQDSSPDEGRDIRLNADADSLETCAGMSAPFDCVGALRLLDEPFISVDGVTELSTSFPLELIIFHLEDAPVRSASPTSGQLVLTDGTIVSVVDGTQISGAKPNGEPPSDTQLTTAQAVESALAAGEVVVVSGHAVLQTSLPIQLVGIELDLQIDTSATPPPENQTIAFQAPVLDVAPEVGIITLPLETDVRVTKATAIEGDYTNLASLDDVVGNGGAVRAEVVGTVEETEPRLVVLAKSVRLTARPVQP